MHAKVVQKLIEDLKEAVALVKANPDRNKKGSAALYGYVAYVPDKCIVDEFVLNLFSELYTQREDSIIDEYSNKLLK